MRPVRLSFPLLSKLIRTLPLLWSSNRTPPACSRSRGGSSSLVATIHRSAASRRCAWRPALSFAATPRGNAISTRRRGCQANIAHLSSRRRPRREPAYSPAARRPPRNGGRRSRPSLRPSRPRQTRSPLPPARCCWPRERWPPTSRTCPLPPLRPAQRRSDPRSKRPTAAHA
eukprot:2503173-Prymnesium_polylepis.1